MAREKAFQDPGFSETSPYLGTRARNRDVQTPFESSDSGLQKHTVSQQVPQVRWQDSWKKFLQAKVQGLSPADHITLGTHYMNFKRLFQTLDILSAVLVVLVNLVFSHILQAVRLIFVYASLSCDANQGTAFGEADSNIVLI